ncbi:helix-turn-helix domain-containing protein [Dyella japonica]|uniref:Excisionase family DNA binding protein n=1 Tax=Dyella japonica TaxID=231455 RepID=A0ABV2JYL4_9GAMM
MTNAVKPTTTEPLVHSMDSACARLSIGKDTLYTLLAQGDLKAFKVGNKPLIPESELQRFIRERMQAAHPR